MEKKLSRRAFAGKSAAAMAAVTLAPLYGRPQNLNGLQHLPGSAKSPGMVRLGSRIYTGYDSPDQWIRALKDLKYGAAYCPVRPGAPAEEIRAYREAAAGADIIISEVGTWSNPISHDEEERKKAFEKCIAGLQLADEIGAACCVNVSGSRNPEYWAGPHKDNLTDETFDMVVESTRKIIDEVKPRNTWFTLEAMPWSFPHSADAYLRLLKAIDRDRFAVHFDPVNIVTSPEIYFHNGAMIRDFFKRLGPHIKSCHAKDITLREDIYTPHLSELRPGLGSLDYGAFLTCLSKLKDVPLMMEHLKSAEEYALAAAYIREVAARHNIRC